KRNLCKEFGDHYELNIENIKCVTFYQESKKIKRNLGTSLNKNIKPKLAILFSTYKLRTFTSSSWTHHSAPNKNAVQHELNGIASKVAYLDKNATKNFVSSTSDHSVARAHTIDFI
ncbi:hypothetical protein, partial [Undibacterium sp.]|uniref:hypothetical protein n=1 Tax=Undibacterium sp. TaxID=1914977 RepID=UPI00375051D8